MNENSVKQATTAANASYEVSVKIWREFSHQVFKSQLVEKQDIVTINCMRGGKNWQVEGPEEPVRSKDRDIYTQQVNEFHTHWDVWSVNYYDFTAPY